MAFCLGAHLVAYRAYQLSQSSGELQREMLRYAFWSAAVGGTVFVATLIAELVIRLKKLDRGYDHGRP
jgi:hypothetical protein